MNKPKYIMLYNGIPFYGDSLKELATKYMGYKVIETESSFNVYINGDRVRSYVNAISDKRNGYTLEEVERYFFEHFAVAFSCKNLCFYQLMT